MKKSLLSVTILIISLFFFGCSTPALSTKDDESSELNEIIENDIRQLITAEYENIVDFVMLNDFGDEGKNISVHLYSNVKYANLGDYFKTITNICSDYATVNEVFIDRLTISVYQDDNPAFIFDTSDFKSAFLTDYRSGEGKLTKLNAIDELASIFPAMKFTEAQAKLPQDVVDTYNEVMKKLSESPSTPEDILFEQIAPDYDMTAYELEAFMKNAIVGMNGGEYTPLPDNFGFEYIEAPGSVYTTTGKENGLMDTGMYASGVILNFEITPEELSYFILENEHGQMLIAQDKTIDKIGNTERWDQLKEGDNVTVYFAYQGWIDEDFYTGGNGIYFTCLLEHEDISEQKKWIQKWYNDYIS